MLTTPATMTWPLGDKGRVWLDQHTTVTRVSELGWLVFKAFELEAVTEDVDGSLVGAPWACECVDMAAMKIDLGDANEHE